MAAIDAPPERTAPRALRSGSGRVWTLAGVLAVLASVTFAMWVVPLAPPPGNLHLPWPVLLPLFAGAEIYVVDLQFRRDAHSFSLSEIPLVLGLAGASPVGFLAARILGAGAALVLHRHQRGMKLVFNLSSFALETCLAIAVFRAVLGSTDPSQPQGWVAAFAAMLVSDLLGAISITAAIALYEWRLDRRMFREVVLAGGVAMGTNTSLGLVAVILLTSDVRAAGLLLVLAVVLFVGYRGYTSLTQGYARLELLYGFTRAVGRSVQPEAVLRTVLLQARDLLRAEEVEIRITGAGWDPLLIRLLPDGETTAVVDEASTAESWWAPALDGEAVLVPRGSRVEEARRQLAAAMHKDGMAVPLRGERGIIGVVLAFDRLGDVSTFGGEDLKLFETLANHASVSLENGRLVDRLQEEVAEREHQALHDALTGLPNRRLFGTCVASAIAGAEASGRSIAVLLMDLNRFKDINDTLGHRVGDEVLTEIGTRLATIMRGVDTVARLGGDEFVALCESLSTVERDLVLRRIHDALDVPMMIDGEVVRVGASVGTATTTDPTMDMVDLLALADQSMYRDKQARKEAG